jgi:hypothetical protein
LAIGFSSLPVRETIARRPVNDPVSPDLGQSLALARIRENLHLFPQTEKTLPRMQHRPPHRIEHIHLRHKGQDPEPEPQRKLNPLQMPRQHIHRPLQGRIGRRGIIRGILCAHPAFSAMLPTPSTGFPTRE